MAQQYIYQMERLTKRLDDGRELLSNFWLSFYHGAKIGIIGHNGSGKSTILRIMAGVDKEYDGHTWIEPEAKIGYLRQEPVLDPHLNVRQNVGYSLKVQKMDASSMDRNIDEILEVVCYGCAPCSSSIRTRCN